MALRILQVVSRLTYGGAAALIAQWATYLHKAGYQVDVCTIYSKGQFGEKLEQEGVTIYNLNLDPDHRTYQPRRKYDFRVVRPLVHVMKNGSYDIIHAHLFPTSLFVAVASYFALGPSYVISEHSISNRRRRLRAFKFLDYVVYSRYARIIAVSEQVRQALLRWLPGLEERVRMVPNSVDPERFTVPDWQVHRVRQELGITKRDRVILYAGRLIYDKGPDVLLKALLGLPEQVGSLKVLVAGDGPLDKDLRRQVKSLSLDRMVTFLGLRKDVPILLNVADLVVMPSRREGLPMILLEAMSARKPVIAAAVGGIPEVIEHGISGWLVPAEDHRALAKGIALLLHSTDLYNTLSNNAYQRVHMQYSTDVTIKKLIGIYYEVLSTR